VDFSAGASPGNLPGGNNVSPVFSASTGLTADSNPPAQPNGVNPGEFLEIVFAANANDVLDAINGSTLRIGIHVQGFSGGGSESFINRPNPVPEPTTMLLLGLGLIGLAGVGRRKFIK
jgi:hypothetical protein